MRTHSADSQAHLEKINTRVATLVQFRRADGNVTVGVTNYGEDVPKNLGQGLVNFKSRPGFVGSLLEFLQGIQDQSAQIQTYVTNRIEADPVFNENQIRAGFWLDAKFTVATVNPRARSSTPVILLAGKLGRMTLNGVALEMEILGLANALSQPVAFIATDQCPHALYSSTPLHFACHVLDEPGPWLASTAVEAKASGQWGHSVFRAVNASVEPDFNHRQYWCISTGITGTSPPTFPTTVNTEYTDGTARFITKMAYTFRGSVISVSGFKVEFGPAIDTSAGWFENGTFLFDTSTLPPANPFDIQSFDASAQIFTLKPRRALNVFPPRVGNSVRAVAGCNHLRGSTGDCVVKFANWLNFGGFDQTPTEVEVKETVKRE